MQLVKVPKNSQLENVDLMSVRRDILSHHFIKDVVVERDLPATLRVTVQERVPLAIINAAEFLYIDEDGVVLPHSISKQLIDLPVLSGLPVDGTMKPGTRLNNVEVQEALNILSGSKAVSKELYHLISEVRLRNGGDIVLYTAERGVPVIFGRGEIPSKLVRLESFWNEIVREQGAQNLQYVDLRFEDQVVVRWTSKKS
jgi:cell division protein FtsQ